MVAVLSLVVLFSPSSPGVAPFPGSDKVVHLGLFAALAGTTRWRFGASAAALWAVASYAVVSEIIQGEALPGRSGDPVDVLADLVGVAAGWLAARRCLRP